MVFRNLKNLDMYLVATAVVAMLGSIFLIVNDSWLYQLQSDSIRRLEKVGTVKFAERDVRRRYKVRFSWMPLAQDHEIFKGDSIFTGDKSSAVIKTDSGDEISISPNSLVVVSTKEDSLFLDIDFGSIQGKVEKDSKILVGSQNKVTEFSGEQAIVRVDVDREKKLVVNVIEGQVQLTSGGASQTLNRDQATEITEDKIENDGIETIVLSGPLANAIVEVQPNRPTPRSLHWKSSYPFRAYVVQLARDPYFKNIVLEKSTLVTSLQINDIIEDQKLYWRVKAQEHTESVITSSDTAYFILTSNTPPITVFPRNGMEVSYERQTSNSDSLSEKQPTTQKSLQVILNWKAESPADLWEIQTANDTLFKTHLVSYLSKSTNAKTDQLTKGKYFWRVKSKSSIRPKWSNPSHFFVTSKMANSIGVPIPQNTDEKFEILTNFEGDNPEVLKSPSKQDVYRFSKETPTLEWSPVSGARKYFLEVSRDFRFKSALIKKSLTKTSYHWKDPALGNHYWRVRAISTSGQSKPSTPQQLIVVLAPPKSVTDEVTIETVPELSLMESPPPPFVLKWKPVLFAFSYELEFDRSRDFKKPLALKTANSQRKVQVQAPGIYYWRVRAVGRAGMPISKFTEPQKYEFIREYSNPEKESELRALSPQQRQTLLFVGKGKNTIRFKWSTPYKDGTIYQLELSQYADFRKSFYRAKTLKGTYKFVGNTPQGWIYWRLRARNKHFGSPWTAANRFQVKYESSFDLNESLKRQASKKRLQNMQSIKLERSRSVSGKKTAPESEFPELAVPIVTQAKSIFSLKPALEATKNAQDLKRLTAADVASKIQQVPVLKWQTVENADRYLIEIAKDPKFNLISIREEVRTAEFKWLQAIPGKFYWRVNSDGVKFRPSNFSKPSTFAVNLAPPRPYGPGQVIQVIKEGARSGKVPAFTLEWTPTPHTHHYEVKLSKTIDFQQTKTIASKAPTKKIKVSRTGKYFWKVRSVSAKGTPLSEFSQEQTVDVTRIAGAENGSATQGLFPRHNRQISTNSQAPWTPVKFVWQGSPSAQFQLVISKSEAFSDPIYNEAIDKNHAHLLLEPTTGTYYWKVGYISDPSRPMLWTDTYTFQLTPPLDNSTDSIENRVPTSDRTRK